MSWMEQPTWRLGGFKGMLMGSTSSACARHSRCPVVIVPAPESEATELV
jgi:nucleotide-binding universal stress UspA family protein